MVNRLRDPGPHAGRGAEGAVEARVVDHLDDRRDPAALVTDHPRPGRAELDLRRGVRAVSELVLEPLDVEPVALPARLEAGEQVAGEPAVGLRQDQERVTHGSRAEPLVARDLVLPARSAPVERPGNRGVGANVRAPLLLGHRHPAEGSLLVGSGHEPLAVVFE